MVSELGNVVFDEWVGLGMPSVKAIVDTSDTISYFQETELRWDVGDLVETLIDTSIQYRTFSLSLSSGNSSFFELYSREYSSGSLDPKIGFITGEKLDEILILLL